MRLPRLSRRQATMGGGSVAALAALGAGTLAARNRYITGSSPVVQLLEAQDGGLVVVLRDMVFWAPAHMRDQVKSYEGSASRPLPYRIHRFQRRRPDGLLIGTVNTGR